jgi:hypothetical protein
MGSFSKWVMCQNWFTIVRGWVMCQISHVSKLVHDCSWLGSCVKTGSRLFVGSCVKTGSRLFVVGSCQNWFTIVRGSKAFVWRF